MIAAVLGGDMASLHPSAAASSYSHLTLPKFSKGYVTVIFMFWGEILLKFKLNTLLEYRMPLKHQKKEIESFLPKGRQTIIRYVNETDFKSRDEDNKQTMGS